LVTYEAYLESSRAATERGDGGRERPGPLDERGLTMTFTPIDAWVFKRLLTGCALNSELPFVSELWKAPAGLLDTLPATDRLSAWQGALSLRADHDAIRQAVMNADPNAPMPAPSARKFATGADVQRMGSAARWFWKWWIPADSIFGIAAPEGVGKTRLLMDLAWRIYFGSDWPDGQPATFPAGSPTLWICADGQQAEIVSLAVAMGLPPQAIIFPAPEDEPMTNTSLDDSDTWDWIEEAIEVCRPALMFIDTLTYATTMDLCDQKSIAKLKTPLVNLCQKHQTSIGLSLHVSREGQALGRRIKGLTRVLFHLECPEPERASERLRLWVEKTFDQKPSPLGCTIHTDRMDYDSNAPPKAVRNAAHRPRRERADAAQFIRDELTKQNDQIGNELCKRWKGGSPETFWRAVNDMVAAAELATNGGPGTRQQMVLHLTQNSAKP
jgi:hypothetical protein